MIQPLLSLPPVLFGAWPALAEYWGAGGWLMLPLAAITFVIWHQYLALRQRLSRALATSADDARLEPLLRPTAAPGDADLRRVAELPGAVPVVLRHLHARVTAGLPQREAFSQCREAELADYKHAFYILGACVTAAPLLGLLGTVLGMIDTFMAVGPRAGETSVLVARGISQALITTQVGLVAALPGAVGLAHAYRLYVRLTQTLDRLGSRLILAARN